MIERVNWSGEAEQFLARALNRSVLAIVAAEVSQGVSMLWHCESSEHRAYCVTRVHPNPRELVIVAFAGSGMHTFAPAFLQAARSRGLPLRAHTVSPVVARLVRKFGFQQSEYVLRAA